MKKEPPNNRKLVLFADKNKENKDERCLCTNSPNSYRSCPIHRNNAAGFDSRENGEDGMIHYEGLPSLIKRIVIYPSTEENVNEVFLTNGKKFTMPTEKLLKMENWKIKIFDTCGKVLAPATWQERNMDTGRMVQKRENWNEFLAYMRNSVEVEEKKIEELTEEIEVQEKIKTAITTFCKKIEKPDDSEITSIFVYWETSDGVFVPTDTVRQILKKSELVITLRKLREFLSPNLASNTTTVRIKDKVLRCWVFKKEFLG